MEKNFATAVVVLGHYGSGKTNLAVNLALDCKRRGEEVSLCDLDIVNPYFRSADFAGLAAQEGVELVSPPFAGSNLDLPSVTPRLDAVLGQPDRTVIIDVGGDDAGAIALGRYAAKLEMAQAQVLYVINESRPLIAQPHQAVELLREIEAAAHLRATHIVNSTHLCGLTDQSLIRQSEDYARQVSALAGLPLLFTVVHRPLVEGLALEGEIYPVELFVKLPWD